MSSTNSLKFDPELTKLLTRYATYSTIDRGLNLSQDGHVTEINKSAGKLKASVQSEDLTETFQVEIETRSHRHLKAHCDCSSDGDLEEWWCEHLIATVWHSKNAELIDWEPYFQHSENALQNVSAHDLAEAVSEAIEISKNISEPIKEIPFNLALEVYSPYLGVRVLYPKSFDLDAGSLDPLHNSTRELNHILAEILESYANWDDEQSLWFIEDSQAIHRLLGLLPEYPKVTWLKSNKLVDLQNSSVHAQVELEWMDQAAELKLLWYNQSDGKLIKGAAQLIGNTAYWIVVDQKVYTVERASSSMAKFFESAQSIRLPRYRCAAILERINDPLFTNFVAIKNPKQTPQTEVKKPEISVDFEDLFSADREQIGLAQILLEATIKFVYPASPNNQDLIYLPDREAEEACLNSLLARGFEITNNNRVSIAADAALELLHQYKNFFPADWKVSGLESKLKNFKFSELKIKLDLSKSENKDNKPGKIDWFSCNLELLQNSARLSLAKLFRARPSRNDSWIQLDDGSFARIPGGSLARLRTSLSALLPEHSYESKVSGEISTAQALGLLGLEDQQITVKAHKSLVDVYEKLKNFTNIPEINCPKDFKGKLRSYQNDGLRWLNFLKENCLNGILADEMGLGKTIQTLAFLSHIQQQNKKSKIVKVKPALVICPTSVTTNWLLEAKKFAPNLKVLLLQGKDRKAQFAHVSEYDLVITSYALLRIDRLQLEKFDFLITILDEAQNIKNPSAAVTQAAKSLRSDHRLVLTGTPTENRPLELWSIFDYLMPGYLGGYDYFKNYIEKPILEGGLETQAVRFLTSKTKPFILRRVKSEVEKQLPPKIESIIHVPMADSQKMLYASVLNEIKPKIFAEVNKKGVKGASISILAALMRLRQICNHPNSIAGFENDETYSSGKYEALQELISEGLDSNRKIIVFCQFIEMLSIIRTWLESLDTPYLYLDGSTRDRQHVVDTFNQDEDVRILLMSLKAGGTGLNLTAADTVVIYDPWWNPAVESQAIDRAHRIGQKKSVNVYRLVTENSIEEKIMELKDKKAQIVDVLINKNGLSGLNLTKNDLEGFFNIGLEPEREEAQF